MNTLHSCYFVGNWKLQDLYHDWTYLPSRHTKESQKQSNVYEDMYNFKSNNHLAFTPLYTTSILPSFWKRLVDENVSGKRIAFICAHDGLLDSVYAIEQNLASPSPNEPAMGCISYGSTVLKVITRSIILWIIYNRLLISFLCVDIGISIHCYPENYKSPTNVVQTSRRSIQSWYKSFGFSFKRIASMYSISRIGIHYSNVTFKIIIIISTQRHTAFPYRHPIDTSITTDPKSFASNYSWSFVQFFFFFRLDFAGHIFM